MAPKTNRVDKDKHFQCQHCSQSCKSASALRSHQRRHEKSDLLHGSVKAPDSTSSQASVNSTSDPRESVSLSQLVDTVHSSKDSALDTLPYNELDVTAQIIRGQRIVVLISKRLQEKLWQHVQTSISEYETVCSICSGRMAVTDLLNLVTTVPSTSSSEPSDWSYIRAYLELAQNIDKLSSKAPEFSLEFLPPRQLEVHLSEEVVAKFVGSEAFKRFDPETKEKVQLGKIEARALEPLVRVAQRSFTDDVAGWRYRYLYLHAVIRFDEATREHRLLPLKALTSVAGIDSQSPALV